MSNEIIKQNSGLYSVGSGSAIDEKNKLILAAALQPQLRKVPQREATNTMIGIVFLAHSIAGRVITPEDAGISADETYRRIMETHPEATLEEIRTAIRSGVYGEYGEFFGLNAMTYVRFVGEYMRSEQRKILIEKFKADNREDTPRKMTVGDWKRAIQHDYKMVIEGTPGLIAFSPKKYILLRKLGLIGLNSAESWQIWLKRGKEERYYQMQRKAAKKEKGEKSLLALVEKFNESINTTGTLPESEFKKIVLNARRLRYLAFFEAMQRRGVTNIFENSSP